MGAFLSVGKGLGAGRSGFQFGGMRQGVLNQINHVLIREFVKKVRARAAPADKALRPQKPQTLRNGGELFFRDSDQLRHAPFASDE
jgi:hypothetical protein